MVIGRSEARHTQVKALEDTTQFDYPLHVPFFYSIYACISPPNINNTKRNIFRLKALPGFIESLSSQRSDAGSTSLQKSSDNSQRDLTRTNSTRPLTEVLNPETKTSNRSFKPRN
jgi:hypothetical protein